MQQTNRLEKCWRPVPDFERARKLARLRIRKSSISKRSFLFQKMIDLREENAFFTLIAAFTTDEQKRGRSSTISRTKYAVAFRISTELATAFA
jgi:hypothetical protein